MGHLTKRGWQTMYDTITSDEAQAFKARCRQSHAVRWRANLRRWQGGEMAMIAQNIPVVGGTLTLDSSDPIRRRLSLQVGAGEEEWTPRDASSLLVPWGQRIHLSVSIDMPDGTWSNWLKVFEGPIQEAIFEQPSQITTLTCSDPGARMEEYLHTRKKGYGDRTLRQAIKQMVDATMDEGAYNIDASDSVDGIMVDTFVAEAGQSRLEAANELAGKWGHEVFFDAIGNLVIRRDLTDEDDANWNPSEAGPDIGDVARPVAQFIDGERGNLIATTVTFSREAAVNGVAINLQALRKTKVSGGDLYWTHLETAGGSVPWGDSFGRLPLVETKDVHKITTANTDRQTQRAKKLLKRRRGMIKFIDFDALPMPWVEPDDRVSISVDGVEENHFLAMVELDLAGGPMRCRTRVLTTPTAT